MVVSITCRRGVVAHTHGSVEEVRTCQGAFSSVGGAPVRLTRAEADLLALAARGYLDGRIAVSPAHREAVARLTERLAPATRYGRAELSAELRAPAVADGPFARREPSDPWAGVDALRDRAAALLVRRERDALVGYFASRVNGGPVKFYRLRRVVEGKWAGRTFVDAQGSDEFYPVRRPEALTAVLEAVLADPAGAALLYATELGRCSRCSRALTDEESRRAGMGPDCRALA